METCKLEKQSKLCTHSKPWGVQNELNVVEETLLGQLIPIYTNSVAFSFFER